jgi:hypothetical protein
MEHQTRTQQVSAIKEHSMVPFNLNHVPNSEKSKCSYRCVEFETNSWYYFKAKLQLMYLKPEMRVLTPAVKKSGTSQKLAVTVQWAMVSDLLKLLGFSWASQVILSLTFLVVLDLHQVPKGVSCYLWCNLSQMILNHVGYPRQCTVVRLTVIVRDMRWHALPWAVHVQDAN